MILIDGMAVDVHSIKIVFDASEANTQRFIRQLRKTAGERFVELPLKKPCLSLILMTTEYGPMYVPCSLGIGKLHRLIAKEQSKYQINPTGSEIVFKNLFIDKHKITEFTEEPEEEIIDPED